MKDLKPYWHAYHMGQLIFWIDYDKRCETIRQHKPKKEQAARLHYMQPIKGELPKEFVEVGQKLNKAREKCNEIWQELCENRAKDRYNILQAKYYETEKNYNKIRRKYNKIEWKYALEINILHNIECPDCVWDGEEMQWDKYKED